MASSVPCSIRSGHPSASVGSGTNHPSIRVVLLAWEGGLALVEAEDLGNNISTYHWLLPISNRTARPMLLFEAEEIAICRFMGELQACADKAVKMVHQAHESIKDVHELFTLQVPPEDIEELSTSITGLLTSTRSHCTAVDQALETFRQHEVCEARDEVCRSIYAGFDK
ncbi:uncharacterized protein [Miscanthus floridulus]|uniref:uncharacterized protein isoform X2 n=1 Tax=Miscanthus floridulus TaxID=154761 RepID=UPI003457B7BF